MRTTLTTIFAASMALLLFAPMALAMPLEMPLQGVLRDNAGAPVSEGEFEMTFRLYPSAEAETASWTEVRQVVVQGGQFRLNLGVEAALEPSLFALSGTLWLGVTVEAEPELPRRPMGTTPYAFQSASAAGLSCSGCVEPEALSPASLQVVREEALVAVAEAGYPMDAATTPVDGEALGVDATNVQGALEALKSLLDEATDGGGAITGNVNEGAGQVVAYELSRDVEGGEALKQYVHLVNPASPKVIAYLYGDQTAVSIDYIPNPSKTGQLNFDTRSHGGGYSPYHEEFWYPQWSGSTIYRYTRQGAYLGSFNSGNSDIMQLWGDVDGSYYTANWGHDRVRKWEGITNPQNQLWEYYLGSTAGGVCSDGQHVYAMRHSGSTVWKLDKDNGELIETFDLPNIPGSLHGGLICLPDRLVYGRHPSEVRIYDLVTRTQLAQFSVQEWVDNASFDGQTMWISNNSSTLYGYNLLQGNMYDELASGNWIVSSGASAKLQQLRAPKEIEIWIDGVNVTDQVGDPNGKGLPHYANGLWGADGQTPWSSGQLDLTNVADWTLGEHLVEFKETGGVGGEVKGYVYVIYPFTESSPPVNDGCDTPVSLEVADGPVVVSGTTEDTMGKILATDTQNGGEGCSVEGGPDAVFRIDLSERSLINAAITAPFPATLYVREGDCETGEVVYCGDDTITTNPLEPGTYYLVVDGDTPAAKGDFTLAASLTPALLPAFDTCDTALELIFSGQGVATHTGSSLYALDQYQGWCDAGGGGADVVYFFQAGTGQTVTIDVTGAEFTPLLHLYRGDVSSCGNQDAVSWCVSDSTLQLQGQQGGTYYLVIDGVADKEWGAYDLTVTLQ